MVKTKTKVRFGSGVDFGLTIEGKTRAEEVSQSNPTTAVLTYLSEGPCSLSDLAEETELGAAKLKQILESLIANGFVQTVKSDNDTE